MSMGTLLVANRGEIAVRIMRSAKRLGMRTVAVFSDADRGALHVHEADVAVHIGGEAAAESYLRGDAIIAAAIQEGAGLIHPGYGFLSENADFARACDRAGRGFVGPTPEQLEVFGAKHTARDQAERAGVPLLPGSGLLASLEDALLEADRIGYPVMLKATAGGGGIGMQGCDTPEQLRTGWDNVRRLAGANFSSAGVFLERRVRRARHIEVQVFGDGHGRVVAMGDRDCSLQRRNQKVLEESPAPDLPEAVRTQITEAAVRLCEQVNYRSAGTVEYIYDAERHEAAFLEVNTRLQVEHPVTEARFGIDLVEWMIRLARGDRDVVSAPPPPRGAAVEARVYAENTDLGNLPSSGTVTAVSWPDGVRVDTWIEPGVTVSTSYDPLLAKVIVQGDDRAEAWSKLHAALRDTRVQGMATNLGLLRAASEDAEVLAGVHDTGTLSTVVNTEPRLEVIRSGVLCTIQDWPGRLGLWSVGIPPSGPMDDWSFRLGNVALGNDEGAPGLEITMGGSALRFHTPTRIMVTGAPTPLTLDGVQVTQWEPVAVGAGQILEVGQATAGMRSYLLVEGGLDVAPVLGSVSTFTDGEMGGTTGAALRPGDIVGLATPASPQAVKAVPAGQRPDFTDYWRIAAMEGPHAAPDFFTVDDMETFYATGWEVHFNSARTGVRLSGPRPRWARPDGGEAGLHPSNIHDTPYSVGAVDYTGDMPILLGPDGPSLGGFTCPATVPTGHRWKLGQLRPGNTVTFVPIGAPQAAALRERPWMSAAADKVPVTDGGVLLEMAPRSDRPSLTVRRQGDAAVLVEYGPMQLDLETRMRIHALSGAIADLRDAGRLAGTLEMTPGIRSLQIQVDPAVTTVEEMAQHVRAIEERLPATDELRVPSRVVHLPLSWDDPATREAIDRYMHGVRDDAPWCPWNIEFIRRINGLDSVEAVYRTVFDAEYLVMGLGDVYLGAPVATPLDPRHRLVTTKYNPARTWTAQNSVGIGGAYLCIYGMEGPGGYQFVGRTTQVWSTLRQRASFEEGTPWLLRFFDRIKWYPVSTEDLMEMRADMAAGRLQLRVSEGHFSVREYRQFLADHATEIEAARSRQRAAFAEERAAWEASGEFERAEEAAGAVVESVQVEIPDGCHAVEAQFAASVFRVDVCRGDLVRRGQRIASVEAMKMEAEILAPQDGEVVDVVVAPGAQVGPGSLLVILRPRELDQESAA
ncbi:urea carboxylase [Propioniciclava soli]|uniref:Urea carboxylase n=1 Tax=Propioniciclava soli TaxID=2775081 RepID=A0ABZ3C3W1_9ACTN